MALKKLQIYQTAPAPNRRNAIYEPELVELMKKGAVQQIVITITPAGYWLAVLANKRIEPQRPGEEATRVTRLRHARIEQEGFAPLYAVRHKSLRIYHNLDTIVKSLMRWGPLPHITFQQGVIA